MTTRRETIKRLGLAAGAATVLPVTAWAAPTLPPIEERVRFNEGLWFWSYLPEEKAELFDALARLDPHHERLGSTGLWHASAVAADEALRFYTVACRKPGARGGYAGGLLFYDHSLDELTETILSARRGLGAYRERMLERVAVTAPLAEEAGFQMTSGPGAVNVIVSSGLARLRFS